MLSVEGITDVLPEKFGGKIPLTDYYRHFTVCMRLNGWNDIDAGQYLASRLQGFALKVLNNLPADQPISFRALVSQLERRFGPGQEAENFMLELRVRRRQKDESLQQLGQAIRDLTSLAYPEMLSDVRERLAKTHFSEAIDDPEIRSAIFRAHPKTLDEAITAALTTESFLHAERARERIRGPRHVRAVGSSVQPVPADERMKKEIEELQSSVQEIRSMMNQMRMNKNSDQPRFVCFNCGEPGHMSRNCTKPYRGNDKRPARWTSGRPDRQTARSTELDVSAEINPWICTIREVNQAMHIPAMIGNQTRQFLIDTGSTISIVSKTVLFQSLPNQMPDSYDTE